MKVRVTSGLRGRRSTADPKVGLFGILGAGNVGNDAQMEAVLGYLRVAHPDAIVDAMCSGPERLTGVYGIAATPLHWQPKGERRSWQGRARQGSAWLEAGGRTSAVRALATIRKALVTGLRLVIDAFRIASWVRRHDVVIVPGAGVLETTMLVRPWEDPYTLFLLCASGWLFGTKVALVSVGADVTGRRMTRVLFGAAARLAAYRSYRDELSRDAMRQLGVNTEPDRVYRDLTFAIPVPTREPGDPRIVGVGVMAYYGSEQDRRQADVRHSSYMTALSSFLLWLIDNDRRIRLFVGDTNGADDSAVQEIISDLEQQRPGLEPECVVAEPASCFGDLITAMSPVGIVVATRYHNLLCALKLSKPTISIGYSAKHDMIMADFGLERFCQPAGALDTSRLIEQFGELESQSPQIRRRLTARNAEYACLLERQFGDLSATLFPPSGAAPSELRYDLTRRAGA